MNFSKLIWMFRLVKVIPRLGIRNVVKVAIYRVALNLSIHPACYTKMDMKEGRFFDPPALPISLTASTRWSDTALYFDHIAVPLSYEGRPNWFFNPTTRLPIKKTADVWWKIPDFASDLSDIKNIWDVSRFSWAIPLAERAACGDPNSLKRLNDWISNWVTENPSYYGYNWKCGQEAAIRIMHLAAVAVVLRQRNSPLPALALLVKVHIVRICLTSAYAKAQDNNHGICEAVGMFVGGAWLVGIDSIGTTIMAKGRRQLEERVRRLILDDGGFSMYSVAYHREFMDALCLAEAWRQFLSLPEFSAAFYERVGRAAEWLAACVQSETGGAPNIGANDGTRLLPITDTDYRDFRPSVQLAMAIFRKTRAYGAAGVWDVPLQWLNIPIPVTVNPSNLSHLSRDSGFCFLRRAKNVCVVIRYPIYAFRPAHADPLHVDMWLGGENVLRGPGSYRYHTEEKWRNYFTGVSAHNTVQFDCLDAMPRLGRFLFGDWLQLDDGPSLVSSSENDIFSASCRHASGALHKREVSLGDNSMSVLDTVTDFKRNAVLRWRLSPGNWVVTADGLRMGEIRIRVTSDVGNDLEMRLVSGWESQYYAEKTPLPVLQITVCRPAHIKTVVEWS